MYRFISLATILIVLAMFTACSTVEPLALKKETVVCKKDMNWHEWEIKFAPAINMIPDLSVENRFKVLNGFNSTKPLTDFNPDRVFLITAPDTLFPTNTQILVFFINDECVTSITPVPTEVIHEWLLGSESKIDLKV
tara:strand:+ start:712 stop:1122 length:411 start_codon:yes stop_codon:yes gene_type:complete